MAKNLPEQARSIPKILICIISEIFE